MASGGDRREPTEGGGEDVPLPETVARNVPIVLFAVDPEGVIARSDGRGLAEFGLEPDEVVGESVLDLYADHPDVLRGVERALDGEIVNVLHETGDTTFEAWYWPRSETGVEGILGVAVDVTERVRYENLLERLNEANRRLLGPGSRGTIAERVVEIANDVLDQPHAGVWFHDPDGGRLVRTAGDGPGSADGRREIDRESVEMDLFRSGRSRSFEDYGAVDHPAFPDASIGSLLCLPLGGHGLLTIAAADAVEFEAAERDLIEVLARDATVALDRAEREHLLERLNEATRELMVAESPAEIADRIVEINRRVLEEPTSVVWYFDPETDRLDPVAWTTTGGATGRAWGTAGEPASIGPGTAEMDVFMGKEPVFFEDYASVEDAAHAGGTLGAVFAVPIGDRGLLTVGAPTAADIGASTPDLVEILARDAAVALERVEREAAFDHLHAATRALMAAGTREEIARLTVDTTDDVLGHPMAVVRLLSEETGRLEPVARSDYIRKHLSPRPSFAVGEGAIGGVFERGEVRTFDRSELELLDVEDATRTLLCLPLGEHGVLSIGESEPMAFDDSDVQLAKVLASNVETALDRIDRELELERRNERLDQFAEIVSHDLRNPLNVVSGQVDLADIGDDRRSSIESGIDRMREIVDDVLALARKGRVVSDPRPTGVRDAARRTWATVGTKEATLTVDTDLRILADGERLRHLFENLFRNAVDHGPDDVNVCVGRLGGGFYVEDDGPGVPSGSRSDVFEPGYTTAEDGTGLGLAIVREVAEAHGWTVSVTEGRDGGARFEVTGVEKA